MSKGDIFILVDLKATVAGNHDHPWTGDDGLFARAAAEIERLQSELNEEENAHAELQSRCFDGVPTHSSIFDERDALKRECEALRLVLTDIAEGNAAGCRDCDYNTGIALAALSPTNPEPK